MEAIYYALNGGATTAYKGLVTVSTPGTTKLTYWAQDYAGNVEPSHTVSFSIASGAVATGISGNTAGWSKRTGSQRRWNGA